MKRGINYCGGRGQLSWRGLTEQEMKYGFEELTEEYQLFTRVVAQEVGQTLSRAPLAG